MGDVSNTPDKSGEKVCEIISLSVTFEGISVKLLTDWESGRAVEPGEEVSRGGTLSEVTFGRTPATVSFEDIPSSPVSASLSEDSVKFNLRLCGMETVSLPLTSTDSCCITTASVTTGRVKGGAEVVVRGNRTSVLSPILTMPSGNVVLVSMTFTVEGAGCGLVLRTSSGGRDLPSTKESLPNGSVGYIVSAEVVALVVVIAASVTVVVLSASVPSTSVKGVAVPVLETKTFSVCSGDVL